MLYLNDSFEGDRTSFYNKVGATVGATVGAGRTADNDMVIDKEACKIIDKITIQPEAGMVLVFEHPLVHSGDELLSGTKYAIRSDIMYKRNPVIGTTP
jgi:hypothetical protein